MQRWTWPRPQKILLFGRLPWHLTAGTEFCAPGMNCRKPILLLNAPGGRGASNFTRETDYLLTRAEEKSWCHPTQNSILSNTFVAMKISKLSIVIPAYNEERTIHLILDKVRDVTLIGGIEKELIIVNDCSADDTEGAIERYRAANPNLNVQYFKHEVNMGKGAALHTGIRRASGEYLIIQDADLEYDPEEYNDLLKPVLAGFADVVYGSRFQGSKPHRILFFWHTIGNKFLTLLSNMFTNLNLTDMETCYKLFRTDMIQSLSLQEQRFGFEPEVTAKISRIPKVRIYEVGISYYGRTYEEGKKIGWRDGVRAIYCIVKYGVFSR